MYCAALLRALHSCKTLSSLLPNGLQPFERKLVLDLILKFGSDLKALRCDMDLKLKGHPQEQTIPKMRTFPNL